MLLVWHPNSDWIEKRIQKYRSERTGPASPASVPRPARPPVPASLARNTSIGASIPSPGVGTHHHPAPLRQPHFGSASASRLAVTTTTTTAGGARPVGRPSSSTSEAESQNSATIAALAAKQHRHASQQNNTHRQDDEGDDVDEDVEAMEAMMEIEEAEMVVAPPPPPRANPAPPAAPPRPAAAPAFRPAALNGGTTASTSAAAPGRVVLPSEDLDALCAGVNFDEPDMFDDENVDVFVGAAGRRAPAAAAVQNPPGPLTSTPQRVKGARSAAAAAATDLDELVIDDDVALVRSTRKAVVPAQAPPPKQHAWTRDVYKALRQRFGLKEFRSHQEAAINATLSGKDVFVLLPTGGGKSLCFQLPAVISSGVTRGLTIVVSPLLSLISDQTRALYNKDIPVVFLSSTMPAEDRRFVMSCLRASPPQACLAYVTPEQVGFFYLCASARSNR
jgi:hypothetical protein